MRPITNAEIRHPNRWWQGKVLITARRLSTGHKSIEAGRLVVVERKYGGLEVRSITCPHCGVRFSAGKVPYRYLRWPTWDGLPGLEYTTMELAP